MATYKIKVILRAIELGSLTKAAAEYEYSASALSQMLTSLEDEIGIKLMTDPFVAVLPNSYDLEDDSISCEELFKNKFIMPKDRNISSYVHRCAGENKLSINSTDDSCVIALVRADMVGLFFQGWLLSEQRG